MDTSRSGQLVSSWASPLYEQLATPLAEVLGAPTAKALEKLRLYDVSDLLHHLPRRYITGTQTTDLSTLAPGDDIAVIARVASMRVEGQDSRRPRLAVVLTDGTGFLDVTFFGKQRLLKYWQSQLSKGTTGIFIGKVSVFRHQLQMAHPTFVMVDDAGSIVGVADQARESMLNQVRRTGPVPIYRSTAKMPTWQIAECVELVLNLIAGLDDPIGEHIRQRFGQLTPLAQAFEAVHHPKTLDEVEPARQRLIMEEALAVQLTMARRRAELAQRTCPRIVASSGGIADQFDARLPFDLTDGQREVGETIRADLARDYPMHRLIQGEVGSGKTIVALRAMLAAVDAGYQAALMAPTEVLASQHAHSIAQMLGDLAEAGTLSAPSCATRVVSLTGSMSTHARQEALSQIVTGEAGIVIGTHALLSDRVDFFKLGLLVVDEQHRFGVEQRAAIQANQHTGVHSLVLTATPIPRSIAMTVFGDLEVSTLTSIPAGRQEIQTTVIDMHTNPAWLDRAWHRIAEEVALGRQAFVVCPSITPGDDEGSSGASVEEIYSYLATGPLKGVRIAPLHGRMAPAEKDRVMDQFASGALDVIVSTTVIEVGVDIPNATVMAIMDADRFGISQLHQLRGRIGRGTLPGLCLLVTSCEPDSVAAERLRAVAASRDGFHLAQVDLAQRKEGDVLGARQSGGRSTLRVMHVTDDVDIIESARDIAQDLVENDGDDPWVKDLCHMIDQRTRDAHWIDGG